MAFAVSWNPFVKSNASATTTTITRMATSCTALVNHYLGARPSRDRCGLCDGRTPYALDIPSQ